MSVCPPDHKHGETGSCYTRHACRCAPCREAHAQQRFYSRHMQQAGKRLATEKVNGRGVRRRLQALMARGWSLGLIGAEAGVTAGSVSLWLRSSGVVTYGTQQTVEAIYDRLWAAEPPRATQSERYAYSRSLRLAEKRGYVVPLAWDDIDLDEAPPVPEAVGVEFDHAKVEQAVRGALMELTVAERREAAYRLSLKQMGTTDIAAHLGISRSAVEWVLNTHESNQREAA